MQHVKEITTNNTTGRATVWDWLAIKHRVFSRHEVSAAVLAHNMARKIAETDKSLQKFITRRVTSLGKPAESHILATSSENFVTNLYDTVEEVTGMSDLYLGYLALASDAVHGENGRALQAAINPPLLREVGNIKVFSLRALRASMTSYDAPFPRMALNRAMDQYEDPRISPYFLENPDGPPYLRANVDPDILGKSLLEISREHLMHDKDRALQIGEITINEFTHRLGELITGNRFMTPEEFLEHGN